LRNARRTARRSAVPVWAHVAKKKRLAADLLIKIVARDIFFRFRWGLCAPIF